jgi:hypothetical protein
VGQLPDEAEDQVSPTTLRELIRPDPLQPGGCLGIGETSRAAFQGTEQVFDRHLPWSRPGAHASLDGGSYAPPGDIEACPLLTPLPGWESFERALATALSVSSTRGRTTE